MLGNLTKCILFDLGNTLVQYFEREELPEILKKALAEVRDYVDEEGLLKVSPEEMWRRAGLEHENMDYSVRPLEERLVRIFLLSPRNLTDELLMAMCRRFMKPIFALGRCYDETLPVLQELRRRGHKLAVVSNTPWGSPALLWREELNRLDLSQLLDIAVFCRDVGWRKPARQIFEYTLAKLDVSPKDCLFIGDDPRSDMIGPASVGMEAIFLDRQQSTRAEKTESIQSLRELLSLNL